MNYKYSITKGYPFRQNRVIVAIAFMRDNLINDLVHMAYDNAGIGDICVVAAKDPDVNCNIAYNKIIELTADQSQYVCFIGDDCLPQPGYIKHALDTMATLPDGWGVVALNEGQGIDRPSHILADRKVIPLLGGELLHSAYNHNCGDIEIKERMSAIGRYAFSEKAMVIHNHPIFTGVPTDEVYDKSTSSNNKADQKLLRSRRVSGWPTINIKDYR